MREGIGRLWFVPKTHQVTFEQHEQKCLEMEAKWPAIQSRAIAF